MVIKKKKFKRISGNEFTTKKSGGDRTITSGSGESITAKAGENVTTRKTGRGAIKSVGETPGFTTTSGGTNTTRFGKLPPQEALGGNIKLQPEAEADVRAKLQQKAEITERVEQETPVIKDKEKAGILQNIARGIELVDTLGGTLPGTGVSEFTTQEGDQATLFAQGAEIGQSAGAGGALSLGKKAVLDPVEVGLTSEKVVKASEEILKLGKGKTVAEKAIFREIKIKEISNILNISENATARLVNSYTKWGKSKIMKFLTSHPGKLTAAALVTTGGTVMGGDMITTWYGLDNIADGLTFTIQSAQNGIDAGTLTKGEALSLLEDQEILYDLAIAKVDTSARWNPGTFTASDLIKKGVRAKKLKYDIDKEVFLSKF